MVGLQFARKLSLNGLGSGGFPGKGPARFAFSLAGKAGNSVARVLSAGTYGLGSAAHCDIIIPGAPPDILRLRCHETFFWASIEIEPTIDLEIEGVFVSAGQARRYSREVKIVVGQYEFSVAPQGALNGKLVLPPTNALVPKPVHLVAVGLIIACVALLQWRFSEASNPVEIKTERRQPERNKLEIVNLQSLLTNLNLAPPYSVRTENGKTILAGAPAADERERLIEALDHVELSGGSVEIVTHAPPDLFGGVEILMSKPDQEVLLSDGRRLNIGDQVPGGGVLDRVIGRSIRVRGKNFSELISFGAH